MILRRERLSAPACPSLFNPPLLREKVYHLTPVALPDLLTDSFNDVPYSPDPKNGFDVEDDEVALEVFSQRSEIRDSFLFASRIKASES